jgi:predicted ATPase/DNA-binding SARP family transcriptional activator
VSQQVGGSGSLFYGLLGPIAAWRDSTPLPLGTPQQQRLLALLILHRNASVSTERIIDALWQRDVPTHAVQTVRTYVSRLRDVLGSEASRLTTEPGAYRLALRHGEVDVDRFQALAQSGRELLEEGDAATARDRLEEALALVRGPPLAGLEYDDFARYEIERLGELQLLVLEDLFEARLLQGGHDELIPELRAAVDRQPLRERLRGQLMLALYRAGRQADALEVFRAARRRLADELGLEPGPELRELERLILLQDRTLEYGNVGRLHGVPRYVTSFVGREAELAALRERLGDDRLVTIVGPAGSGKTRLAAEAVLLVRDAFPEGVWWVELGSANAVRLPLAIADALGLKLNPARPVSDAVVSRLRAAQVLIVLDNCDHVASDLAPLLARIAAECEPAALLATSREPIRIAGERVHRLEPLSLAPADTRDAGALLESEAARLFLARASSGGASVTLDEATTHAVAAVASRLDGLPLAIELAAAKARSLPLHELARSLELGIGLLATGERSAPPRQRTLEAAISWSFDLLSREERALLDSFAVFPASFDLEAARAVGASESVTPDRVLEPLSELVDKSLVNTELTGETRYKLLTTVRLYAVGHALRRDEFEAASVRHRDHFAERADQLFWHLLGPDLKLWLARGRAEHANFHAALSSSLERGDADAALRIASALSTYWFRTGRMQQWHEFLGRALPEADANSRWRPRALVAWAWLSFLEGAQDALAHARDAVEACEEAGGDLLGLALIALADCLIARGQLADAEGSVARAREVFAETAFPEAQHLVEEVTASVLSARGDFHGALLHHRRSRDFYRELRGNLDAGWTLVRLTRAALAAGEVHEAAAAASDAVHDFRVRGDPRGLAAAFTALGSSYAAKGDDERARALLVEAVELAREGGYPVELAQAQATLAQLAPAGLGAV